MDELIAAMEKINNSRQMVMVHLSLYEKARQMLRHYPLVAVQGSSLCPPDKVYVFPGHAIRVLGPWPPGTPPAA